MLALLELARGELPVELEEAELVLGEGRSERRDNLYDAREDLAETSSLSGPPPRRTSLLLEAQMNPLGPAGLMIGLGAALVPELAMVNRPEGIVTLDVPEIRLARSIFALRTGDADDARVRLFMDQLAEILRSQSIGPKHTARGYAPTAAR